MASRLSDRIGSQLHWQISSHAPCTSLPSFPFSTFSRGGLRPFVWPTGFRYSSCLGDRCLLQRVQSSEALTIAILNLRQAHTICNMHNQTVIRANAKIPKARCPLAIYLPLVRSIVATSGRSTGTMRRRVWPYPTPLLIKNIQMSRQVILIPLLVFRRLAQALITVARHESANTTSDNTDRYWAGRIYFLRGQ